MDWIELVTKVGFPIAVAIVLITFTLQRMKRLEERLDEIEDKDRKEMRDVINANTTAMNTLQNTLRGRPCLVKEPNPMGE